jgi:hypothetical protein
VSTAASELSTFARFTATLPGYLRRRMEAAEARRRLADTVANREENFLRIVERGVFGNPASPYRHLFRLAGAELGDVRAMVRSDGLDTALGRLYDAGMYVTLDEVKGRRPIERPGLALPITTAAFDNPLMTGHYQGMSSGSRGPRTRVNIDLALLEHEAAYVHQYLDGFDLWRRPYAVWRPVPPVVTAVKWILRLEKLGKPLERWFSQTRVAFRDGHWKFAIFTAATVAEGRALGRRFPRPQYVPADSPEPVAEWLAEMTRRGTPAVLDTMVSSAVRVCSRAKEQGIDISGTLFRLGGEPLTDAKAQLIAQVGGRSICFYSITEMSFVGAPCAEPDALDDVHLLTDKVAALLRPKRIGAASVDALIYTTLLPSSPKLLINVESGDYARVSHRACSCPMGRLGFTTHLSHIRSYEKLTSEGVTFLGTELLRLVDEVLPGSFGGAPTDYQFVEAEDDGLSRILIVASPKLGPLDEHVVIERVIETLSLYPGGSVMTQHWRQGQTLKLVRREPYQTASAKILPLHLHRLTAAPGERVQDQPIGVPQSRSSRTRQSARTR